MLIIPINAMAAQQLNVVLSGQYCVITLRQKGDRIYLDLDSNENPVCRGAICVNGADIVQSPSPYFEGTLHFIDLTGQAAPGWEELNSRYYLTYAEADVALPDELKF